jgi:hypothetical protein
MNGNLILENTKPLKKPFKPRLLEQYNNWSQGGYLIIDPYA